MPEEFLFSDLTYKIRGCCFEVVNSIGCGQKEIINQKSLAKELKTQHITFIQEPSFPVFYKSEKVGLYRPDFLIENKVILELKSLDYLPEKSVQQLKTYLKGSTFEIGLLVNFGGPKIQLKRLSWFHSKAK